MNTHRYWFRAKRYGWGWGMPLTWEGWVVLVVWLGLFLATAVSLRSRLHTGEGILYLFGMVVALFGVCYWKGEPARWRSGND